MTMFLAPYTAIADVDGSPLDAGFLYLGEYGKDPVGFPVEVFWDADFTVPAAQPIRTRNGYPVRNGSPAKVYLKTAQHSIAIKNKKGSFVLVDFYNKGWDASFVVDASGKNQQEINNEYAQRFKTVADPRNFGAPNNGVSDDAPGIREAIAFLDSLGGGELYMVSNIKWVAKSLHTNNQDAFVISNVIRVNFGNKITTLEVGTDMRSLFKLADGYQGFIDFFGGILQGKKLTDYILYGDPSSFTPYMQITGTQCRSAKEYAASINPYMSEFNNAHFSFSKGGLLLNNKNAIAEITSTQLNTCYANGNEEFGFKGYNRLIYARLDSCGVDDCGGVAYDLDMQGGGITNCGAERAVKLLRMPNVNDGVAVTGMVGIGIGSLDSNSPSDAAVEISGSGSLPIHLNGIRLLSHPTQQRYRDTDLLVRASQNKYPRVITDSFTRARTRVITEAGVVPIFDEPITFTVSAFRKSGTETYNVTDLKTRLDELNKNQLDFRHVIQLTEGSEDSEKVIEGIHGTGIFTIQGVGTDNTKAKIRGARLGLTIRNCSATIIIRYLTIENNTGYDDSALAQVTVDNCREVIFEAVKFDATKNAVGTAIRAVNNSHVKIRGETIADNGHSAIAAYQAQSGSTIEIEPRSAPPATGRWVIGQRIKNSNIGTSNIIEWVRVRNAANTADEWRAVTV